MELCSGNLELDIERDKPGIMVYVWNPKTWKVETGGSQVQGHP